MNRTIISFPFINLLNCELPLEYHAAYKYSVLVPIVKEYVVDFSKATSWADFIAAFNKDFIGPVGGGQWNGNLDAFNDYLWWPEEHRYRLVIRGWNECAPFITQHKTWDDRPVLDVISEIFKQNPQVEVLMYASDPDGVMNSTRD